MKKAAESAPPKKELFESTFFQEITWKVGLDQRLLNDFYRLLCIPDGTKNMIDDFDRRSVASIDRFLSGEIDEPTIDETEKTLKVMEEFFRTMLESAVSHKTVHRAPVGQISYSPIGVWIMPSEKGLKEMDHMHARTLLSTYNRLQDDISDVQRKIIGVRNMVKISNEIAHLLPKEQPITQE